MYSSLDPTSFQPWIDTNSASFKSTEFVWNEVYCNLPAAAKQSAARRDMLLMQATERLVESARFRYFHHSLTYKPHMYSAKRIWSMRFHLRQKMYNTQSNAKHLLFHFETENTTPEFDIANKPGTMMPRSRRIHARTDPTARCPSTSLDGIRSRHHRIIQCAVRPHFLRGQLVEQSKVSGKVLELP